MTKNYRLHNKKTQLEKLVRIVTCLQNQYTLEVICDNELLQLGYSGDLKHKALFSIRDEARLCGIEKYDLGYIEEDQRFMDNAAKKLPWTRWLY